MKLMTLTPTGTSAPVTVSDVVFGAEINDVLLAQAVRVYRACLRQGTAKTKTRSEINRTHKKWFKQKGTGNARHGARTPNIFVGGGVSHGPNGEQNWTLDMPQTMKRQALVSALSAQSGNTVIAEIPTDAKKARLLLKGDIKTLVILETSNQEVIRGIRNMATVLVTTADRLTALDVVGADRIVLSQGAIGRLEARLATAAAAIKPEPVKKTEATKEVVKPVKKAVVKKAVAKKTAKPASKKGATKA